MCQVVPYTFPCCRKVYVDVTKLPSCPNSWPTRKCPPELCIQVRGYEAEDRDSGICWRCQARRTGVDRESLRPRIDRATLVLGLDEIDVSGRRRREEKKGVCWFCGAKGGCGSCGAKDINTEAGEEEVREPRGGGTGKRRRENETRKGEEVVKRVKVERRGLRSSTKALEYPAPENTSRTQQPYTQFYNPSSHMSDQRPQTHYPEVPNQFKNFDAGPSQQSLSANWQSTHTYQNDSSEPANAYAGQQMSHFANDGGQASWPTQYSTNDNLNLHRNDASSNTYDPQLWFDRLNHNEEQMESEPRNHLNGYLSRSGSAMNQALDLQETGISRLYDAGQNEQQNHLYDQDGDQQGLDAQQYGRHSYFSYPYPELQSEGQESYSQDNQQYAQGHSFEIANHYQMTQAFNDKTQQGFQPENISQQPDSDSFLDPNIQPDLDSLPLQWNAAELDDDTLARLIKKYPRPENSYAEMESDREMANEYRGL